MSKNLVKSYFTIQENNEPRIIDSNSRIEEKLERIRYIMSDSSNGFEAGLDANEYSYSEEGEGYEGEGYEGEGYSDGLDGLDKLYEDGYDADSSQEVRSNVIKQSSSDYIPQATMQEIEEIKAQMIQEAEADIAVMKNMAANEISTQKSIAKEEGRALGYEEGIREAREEADRIRMELAEEKERIERLYEERIVDLEPEFVRVLTNIYEEVFKVDLSEDKKIVVNLLRTAMGRIENSSNYIIHVSRDDYPYVSENRQILENACQTAGSTVDLVEDVTMRSGECMIETSGGIYDCGIDTQLSALRKKLILLSYDGREEQ